MVEHSLGHSAELLVPQVRSVSKDVFEGPGLVAEAGFSQPRVHVRTKSVRGGSDGVAFGRGGNGIKCLLSEFDQGVSRLGPLGILLTLVMVLTPDGICTQEPLSECLFHGGAIEREVLLWRAPGGCASPHVGGVRRALLRGSAGAGSLRRRWGLRTGF